MYWILWSTRKTSITLQFEPILKENRNQPIPQTLPCLFSPSPTSIHPFHFHRVHQHQILLFFPLYNDLSIRLVSEVLWNATLTPPTPWVHTLTCRGRERAQLPWPLFPLTSHTHTGTLCCMPIGEWDRDIFTPAGLCTHIDQSIGC